MPKGRCLNIGKPCSKAMNGEIIEAEASNFRCPECGSMLMPWMLDTQTHGEENSKDSSHTNSQPAKEKKGFFARLKGGPLTIIITALIVAVAGLGILAHLLGTNNPKSSIWIADKKKELSIGETYTLSVVFTPSEQEENIVWRSENPDVVEVNNSLLTAKNEGTALVEVYKKSEPTLRATCVVTVKAPIKPGGTLPPTVVASNEVTDNDESPIVEPVENNKEQVEEQVIEKPNVQSNKLAVTLNYNSLKMNVNDKRKVYAYVKNRDGDNITKVVSWSSDDPSVASVDKTGMVVANSPGHARIYASTNNEEAFCSVTVQTKDESVQATKREGNLLQSCFGGAATYDTKKRVVTFQRNATLKDDDNGDINFSKGDVITSVSVSDGYLRYGFYNKKKLHLNNITNPF